VGIGLLDSPITEILFPSVRTQQRGMRESSRPVNIRQFLISMDMILPRVCDMLFSYYCKNIRLSDKMQVFLLTDCLKV